MRILCKEAGGSLEVIEITDIGYDEDILWSEQSFFHKEKVSGLYMLTRDGDFLYIVGIPVYTCDKICREIFKTGMYDLSEYPVYDVLDDIE